MGPIDRKIRATILAALMLPGATAAAAAAIAAPGPITVPAELLAEKARWFFDQARWPHGAPNAWPALPSEQTAAFARSAAGGARDGLLAGVDVELAGTNEPASAINATNTNQIAYASAFEIRVSTDAGGTFQPAIRVIMTGGESPCGDSTLGYDSQGRLFWSYLGCAPGGGISVYLAQVNPTTGVILPGYPVNVTNVVGLPASQGHSHDKEWLAIDRHPTSPFRDRIYLAWTEFDSSTTIWNTWSADQGQTWSPAVDLSSPGEGFRWPVHNAVAADGTYYIAYHAQPGWQGGSPDGISGKQVFLRSDDGGVTFPIRTAAFAAGRADMTYNVQNNANPIPDAIFWLQGSLQPYILPDPRIAGRVYVVSNDDPDDDHSNADHARVYIARSDDFGASWSPPQRIDTGPPGSFQVIPSAAIDPETGAIIVTWYDNRNGQKNGAGHFLLDVFATTSFDGGQSFAPEVQINDVSFDPDPGAPTRWWGPPPTLRIGEYNNVDISACFAFAVWCGNVFSGGVPSSQQAVADTEVAAAVPIGAVGNGLRALAATGDVELSWPESSVTPPLFNVHRGLAKVEIDKSAYAAPVVNPAPLSVGAWSDLGALAGPGGEIYFYEAFASNCAGTSMVE